MRHSAPMSLNVSYTLAWLFEGFAVDLNIKNHNSIFNIIGTSNIWNIAKNTVWVTNKETHIDAMEVCWTSWRRFTWIVELLRILQQCIWESGLIYWNYMIILIANITFTHVEYFNFCWETNIRLPWYQMFMIFFHHHRRCYCLFVGFIN